MSTLGVQAGWGGSENYWFDALNGGVADGWAVELALSRSAYAQEKVGGLVRAGMKVTWNEAPPLSDFARLAAAARRRARPNTPDPEVKRWQRLLGRTDPDLIWFNLPGAGRVFTINQPASLAARSNVPFWVVIQHAFEDEFPANDEQADAARRTLLAAQRVIFIADRNRISVERSIATPLPNAHMSSNTVSKSYLTAASNVSLRHPPRYAGRATLLNLARFEPSFKGQHLLLEILAQPTWLDRDWRLLLVGGGPLIKTLRRLVQYYGFSRDRIEVMGHNRNVLSVIETADLAVLPSLSEGMPYSAIETMAAGRPIVATPVGGLPALVREGETGWLAEALDSRHFGDALERAWSMRAAWREMGRAAAKEVAEHYRTEPVVEELRALMHQDARRSR